MERDQPHTSRLGNAESRDDQIDDCPFVNPHAMNDIVPLCKYRLEQVLLDVVHMAARQGQSELTLPIALLYSWDFQQVETTTQRPRVGLCLA